MSTPYTLKFECSNCGEISRLKDNSLSRSDLESDFGTRFSVQCNHCLISKEYHVNDVNAYEKDNQTILVLMLFALFIGIAVLFLLNAGFVSMFAIGVPITVWSIYRAQAKRRITDFNQQLLSRERNYQPPNIKKIK